MISSTQNLGLPSSTLDLTPTIIHDFHILHSHLLEELETSIVKYLNQGWTLCGALHSVHCMGGEVEFIWAIQKQSEPFE